MCIGYNWLDVHKNALIKLKKTDFWRAMKFINSHLERIDSDTCMQLCMRLHGRIQPCAHHSVLFILFSVAIDPIQNERFGSVSFPNYIDSIYPGHHCKRNENHAQLMHTRVQKNKFHMFFTIESHFSSYVFQFAMIKCCVYLTRKIRKYSTRYQPVTDKKNRVCG